MKINWALVVEVVKALAWPIIAGIAVYLLRRPLVELLTSIAQRAHKVSVFDISFELRSLPVLKTSWTAASTDLRQLTPSQVFDSASRTLFAELLSERRADYAIIDLRSGREWLASRLFLFAVVLGEARRLRAFVFVEKTPGVRRRFLGIATPSNVRRQLGQLYPWLEEAFAKALVANSKQGSPFNAPEPWRSNDFARSFVEAIQTKKIPPVTEKDSYLEFEGPPKIWERTHWLDGERLEQDLDSILDDAFVEDSPDFSRTRIRDAILRRTPQFVAVVDADRRFRGLVDRYSLLEQVAVSDYEEGKDAKSSAS